MNTIIYLGFVTSNEDAYRVQTSFAGNDAEFNFVTRILGEINDSNLYICSYAYNIYNKHSFYMKKTSFDLKHKNNSIRCDALPILNIPILRQITAYLNIYHYLDNLINYLLKQGENINDIMIITCNTYPLFSYPAIKIKKKYGCRLLTYLIDGFYNQESKNILYRYNTIKAIKALVSYNGVIALCQNVINDFCSSIKKCISITPVDTLDNDDLILQDEFDDSRFRLFFAGGIAPLNGIKEYIETLKYLDDTYSFYLYGRGELSEYLTKCAKDDNRIYYKGAVEKRIVMQLEKQSDILFIIRPMEAEQQNNITKYGLPYKLIEYLQSGIPIIASHMLAIPKEFDQYINYCEANPLAIAQKIIEIRNNYPIYKNKSLEAQKYMKENCSWEHYKKTVEEFLYGIH